MMPNMHVLTQDTPCVLLHRVVPGGELKEVATGTLVQPMHMTTMDKAVMRVKLANVVPEFHDVPPPIQPPGSDNNDMVLGDCTTWIMTWPKSQIRLGGGLEGIRCTTGATSRPKIVCPSKPTAVATTLEAPAVVATTRKEPPVVTTAMKEPPIIVATTRK